MTDPTFRDAQTYSWPLVAGGHSSRRVWLLIVATGVAAGLVTGLLMQLLFAVEYWAWHAREDNLLAAVEQVAPASRVAILTLAGVFAGLAMLLLHRYAGHAPTAIGKGLVRGGEMPPALTLGQAIVSIVVVGLGASIGREGAVKKTSGMIGAWLGKRFALPAPDRQLLLACGAGAGLAAAYGVPLGGALFASEVLLGAFDLTVVAATLLCAALATLVSWTMLPTSPTYAVPAYEVTYALAAWALVVGPLLGLAAAVYIRAIRWARTHKPMGKATALVPPIAFALLGLVSIGLPELLGNGKDVVALAFLGEVGLKLLLVLPLLKMIATAGCLASGAPGGVLTPTLTCGSLLGCLLGWFWLIFFPATPLGAYGLIGAAAFLSAATQGPLSSIVLTLELTRTSDNLIVPMILATIGAVWMVRRFGAVTVYTE